MAHKTLIDGTAYEVKGGRCLVDGTVYGIQKGRTLVDGTAFDVSFVGAPIPVTITVVAGIATVIGTYVLINGVKYYDSDATTEVLVGDVITFCIVARAIAGNAQRATLKINGDVVASVSSTNNLATKEYEWTVPENISSISIAVNNTAVSGSIAVTTS